MKTSVNGSTLTIEIDISPAALAAALPSSTGKSRMVASTHGFALVPGAPGVKLSLNLITK
jgi:hypothetical protein